jgi:3-phenylpropionate/cinnamic acid dioxygenase small subunit
MMDTSLTTRTLEQSIHDLLNDYADCLNSDQLAHWPELFLENGKYLILPRENLEAGVDGGYWMYYTSQAMMRDRVTAIQHIIKYNKYYYRHLISNIKIKKNSDDEFGVRSNFLVTLFSYEGKFDTIISGEYRDTVLLSEGALKFKEKLVIPDTFHTPSSIVKPL